MRNIIKYIMDNDIDSKLYYFDKYRIPQSILRNITMYKSEELNFRIEIFNIKRQKTYGLLYGLCNEIGSSMDNDNYDYIFCAPKICSILIAFFRFNNKTIIIFPYLSVEPEYGITHLTNIINDLMRVFNKNIQFDMSYMEDYNSGIDRMFIYLHNIINCEDARILCIMDDQYNNNNTRLFVSDQIRDYKMKIKNIVNKETTIECKNIYNYPIIYQIINRYKNCPDCNFII